MQVDATSLPACPQGIYYTISTVQVECLFSLYCVAIYAFDKLKSLSEVKNNAGDSRGKHRNIMSTFVASRSRICHMVH